MLAKPAIPAPLAPTGEDSVRRQLAALWQEGAYLRPDMAGLQQQRSQGGQSKRHHLLPSQGSATRLMET